MAEYNKNLNEKNYIFINNFYTKCLIGVYPNEKRKKQKLRITICIETKKRNLDDKISSVLSYEKIITELETIKNLKHINLVETLAKHLANSFINYKLVQKIEIQIEKMDILKGNGTVGTKLIVKK